jgi:predicted CopG family antitoxin
MPARKTISIDNEAYAILLAEKEDVRGSFSEAIKRLRANRRIRTVGEMLALENEIHGHLGKTRRHARKIAVR